MRSTTAKIQPILTTRSDNLWSVVPHVFLSRRKGRLNSYSFQRNIFLLYRNIMLSVSENWLGCIGLATRARTSSIFTSLNSKPFLPMIWRRIHPMRTFSWLLSSLWSNQIKLRSGQIGFRVKIQRNFFHPGNQTLYQRIPEPGSG